MLRQAQHKCKKNQKIKASEILAEICEGFEPAIWSYSSAFKLLGVAEE